MNNIPLSVFIIVKNEQGRLPQALKSVKGWADEIIVVDSGSSDNTVEIAKSFTDKTFYNEWKGYGPQKVFAQEQCKNKWCMNIDADEIVTDSLKEHINKLFETKIIDEFDAYNISRKLIFFGNEKLPPLATGEVNIRLYNKEVATFRADRIWDHVISRDPNDEFNFKVSKVGGILLHNCFENYTKWHEKVNNFTSEQALQWFEKGRKGPSNFRIISEFFIMFIKSYIVRRMFVYGIDGFMGAIITAYSRVLKLVKVRELYRFQGENKKD